MSSSIEVYQNGNKVQIYSSVKCINLEDNVIRFFYKGKTVYLIAGDTCTIVIKGYDSTNLSKKKILTPNLTKYNLTIHSNGKEFFKVTAIMVNQITKNSLKFRELPVMMDSLIILSSLDLVSIYQQ